MFHEEWVNCNFSRSKGRGSDEFEGRVANKKKEARKNELFARLILLPDKFPRQPKERFLEVVIGLGRDFEVLQVLLAVESDSTSLHFAFL